MDDFHGILAGVMLGVIACALIVLGATLENHSWENDCSIMNTHRSVSTVYECKVIKHEP